MAMIQVGSFPVPGLSWSRRCQGFMIHAASKSEKSPPKRTKGMPQVLSKSRNGRADKSSISVA